MHSRLFQLSLAALAVLVSIAYYATHALNGHMRSQAYTAQQQLETLQPKLQNLRLQLKDQQDKWNAGLGLSNKVGPAVLNDINTLAEAHENTKLKELLQKYGISFSEAPQPK